MSESVRTHSDEFVIVSVPPLYSHKKQLKGFIPKFPLQESEKRSWQGLDILSIGKVGTKGSFHSSFLSTYIRHNSKYFQDYSPDDNRPPLITFSAISEEQLCKDSAPLNIYSKGCLYQHKDLLYRVFKTDARLVRSVLENAGFASTDTHDWNVLWVGCSAQTYLYEGLNEFQKINHFPNSFELTRKDKMHLNITSMITTHGKDDFDFVPETFLLPDQYNEFYAAYSKNKQTVWIHKPCGSSQGKGIFLVNSLTDIPQSEPCIISRYISNPLLMNDLKFDIRIYVLVSSFDPLRIYVYDEGLARFASETYNPSNKNNRYSHLTNYSINKKNEKFIQNQDWRQDNIGHKWSLNALNKALDSMGVDTTFLWTKIYDIIIKSIISIESNVLESMRNLAVHRNNCFDLFGFDVLVDSDLKPWLLEVNLSPSLATDSPLDLHIKSSLISDTFNLIGVRAFDRKKESVKKVRARIKARQLQLARDKKKLGDTFFGFSDTTQQKSTEIIKETIEEFERRGQFLRIYPSKSSDYYDRFFCGLRPNNKTLFRFLYTELWEADARPPAVILPRDSPKKEQAPPSEEKLAISFEDLLLEYSSRLGHALKALPEETLKQEWKINIENFANHHSWSTPLKQFLLIWQQIDERVCELKRKYFDEKKSMIFKTFSAIRLEMMLRSSSKGMQAELINLLFDDEKAGILSDIIKWLALKAQKHTSYITRRRTKQDDIAVDCSGSYSPTPMTNISHNSSYRRKK